MDDKIEVRESLPDDLVAIETLYPRAFPDEDLLPLVRQLLTEKTIVLSLVGIVDRTLVGHGMFTTCGVSGTNAAVALLGPLGVAPALQRQGVGSAIVSTGLQRLEDRGISNVYVLGDPAYYGRFGFEPDGQVAPPYPLPEEWHGAWQSLALHGDKPPLQGTLSVPQPWLQPRFWSS